jgi:L-2-hydroxyglutarate oxidase
MFKTFDFVVAGAGVVGMHVARQLLQQHAACRIAMVDRALAAGSQASATNSGVLHAGVYYGSDSHKAAFCVRGNASMKAFCRRVNVPLLECGKLIVLTCPSRAHHVPTILRRAADAGAVLHDISKQVRLRLQPSNSRPNFIC